MKIALNPACRALAGVALLLVMSAFTGCGTAPKVENQEEVVSSARTARRAFERSVSGLRTQINHSAGYIVFPDVAQWGIIFGGGSFGRGVVFSPGGTQIGWAAINTGSIGLQAGVQGFRMLMVLQNEAVLEEFMAGKWNGSATGIAVAGESGGSGTAPFQSGVAVYQGANQGLMAGVNIGLNNIRFQPLE